MKTHLSFVHEIDRESRTITIKRDFEAGISLVWDYFTKSELLDQWWAPKPWKATTKIFEFTENGKWFYSMSSPEEEELWSMGIFHDIRKNSSFSINDSFTDSDGAILEGLPSSKSKITFQEKGQSTQVEFIVSFADITLLDQQVEMGFLIGLSMAMENLDELLAKE